MEESQSVTGVNYHPVETKEGNLEFSELILPPLTRPEPKKKDLFKKKWLIPVLIGAIFSVIVAIVIITAVAAGTLISHGDETDRSDDLNASIELKNIKNSKLKLDFQRHLKRFYEELINSHNPEELKEIFYRFQSALTNVKSEDDLRNFVISLGSDDLDIYAREDENDNRLTRDDFRSASHLTDEFHAWYCFLSELKTNLTKYETQKQYSNSRDRLIKRTFVEDRGFKVDARRASEINDLIKKWVQPIGTLFNNSTAIFTGKIMLLSDVAEMLRNKKDLTRNNVYVFASSAIYLDEDLWLPEKNLAIIAPEWKFVRDVSVFVGGLPAIEHEERTAAEGLHGRPGRLGGDGGQFLAVGDVDGYRLKVECDGGKGGDGQNGAGGPDEVGTCRTVLKDLQHKNVYGEVIQYFKVHDRCGGNGKDGGMAGEGGKGGKNIFMNTIKKKTFVNNCKQGPYGKPGRGGRAGKGAKTSCFYIVQGIQENKLQPMSPPICGEEGAPPGLDGRNNFNGWMEERPAIDEKSFVSEALKKYRAFAQEEYLLGDVAIGEFLSQLDELWTFENERDVIDELESIEGTGKIEFYESLTKRIQSALKTKEQTRLMKHLLALTRGKLVALKRGLERSIIVDLESYLEGIADDIDNAELSRFTDHTLPVLVHLVQGKIHYLNESLDRWILKINTDLRDFRFPTMREVLKRDKNYLIRLAEVIDTRAVLRLSLTVAKVLKPLLSQMKSYLSGENESRQAEMPEPLLEFEFLHNKTVNGLIPMMRGRSTAEKTEKAESLGLILTSSEEYSKNRTLFDNVIKHSKVARDAFKKQQERVIKNLKALFETGFHLQDVKRHLDCLESHIKVFVRFVEGDLKSFPIVVERLSTTLDVLDAVREKIDFIKCVDDVRSVKLNDSRIENYLVETMIIEQYGHAVSAFRQWVFPNMAAYSRVFPEPGGVNLEEARSGIRLMTKWVRDYKSTILPYDSYVREATFSPSNSVGEYYKWHNSEIQKELVELFAGKSIALTAEVENFHMLTKGAIKFRTVRIEFQPKNGLLGNLLNNVQIEMKHSGYSHYYYKRKRHLIVGEGFDLHYSYELDRNGEPVNYNMVYRKLMEGPAIFSPYTTWTVRLRPTHVVKKLATYADQLDIVLVGTGSYVEITGDLSD